MARGKPYLATLQQGSMRLYRLDANNVFTSLATTSITMDALSAKAADLRFTGDLAPYDYIRASGLSISGNSTVQARTYALDLYSSVFNSGSFRPYDRLFHFRKSGAFSTMDTLYNRIFHWRGDTTTIVGLLDRIPNNVAMANTNSYGNVSDDESYIFKVLTTGSRQISFGSLSALDANSMPDYSGTGHAVIQNITLPAFPNLDFWKNDCIKFTPDNRKIVLSGYNTAMDSSFVDLITIDPAKAEPIAGTVPVDALQWRYRLTENIGQSKVVAIHPSNKYVAVGFVTMDGTTATTKIYEIQTKQLKLVKTLSGIGQCLSFTKDGRFLIDAARRKAYNYTGSDFVENTTMMANIAAGQMVQALSDHLDQNPLASIYDQGLKFLLSGEDNRNNLFLKTLNRNAFFNPGHSTIAKVTNNGAFEFTGSDIPADGFPLANVSLTEINPTTFELKADNIKKIGLAARVVRSAVIYDKTSGVPVVFLNAQENLPWQVGTALQLPLSGGFVQYTK